MTEPSGQFQPPSMPAAAPVVPGPRRAAWYARPVSVGLAGLLVGAAVIGVPWLLTRDDASTAGPGSSVSGGAGGSKGGALAAPRTLGGYVHQEVAAKGGRSDPRSAKLAVQYVTADRRSTGLLSTAYGGAPAVVQGFASRTLEEFFQLTAVRARSPRPYVAYEDPVRLGLVRPVNEMTSIRDVDCVIYNDATNAGGAPAPDSVHVISCQRTGDGLTVQIRQVSGDVGHEPGRIAALVDQAWSALS